MAFLLSLLKKLNTPMNKHEMYLLQLSLEGEIAESTVKNSLSRGKKADGDLIPWTIANQYQDQEFPKLSGARIIRIATNPNYQGVSTSC